MGNDWSKYFQNAEFLECTRIYTLKPEQSSLVKGWLQLRDGMRILDVGCGTGELSRYLCKTVSGCEFFGVDIDTDFIKEAQKQAVNVNRNSFKFIEGDALKLPFENDSFDLVVSHTFFTAIDRPTAAMKEMYRVGKPGALIASFTAQDLENIPYHPGDYPSEHRYRNEYVQLFNEVFRLYKKHKPLGDYVKGVHPRMIPQFFAKSGLERVAMHSTPNNFSLSDASIDVKTKRNVIELSYTAETKKLDAYLELPAFKDDIGEEVLARYKSLLKERRDTLLQTLGENKAWEWVGGCTTIMTGAIPQK